MQCENCKKELEADAKFCPACGMKVESKPQKIYCMKCGTELGSEAKFCSNCGTEVGTAKNMAAEQLENVKQSNRVINSENSQKTKKLLKKCKEMLINLWKEFMEGEHTINQIVAMIVAFLTMASIDETFFYYTYQGWGEFESKNLSLLDIALELDSEMTISLTLQGVILISGIVVIVGHMKRRKKYAVIGSLGLIIGEIIGWVVFSVWLVALDIADSFLSIIGFSGYADITIWSYIFLFGPCICLIASLLKPISWKKKKE